MRLGSGPGKGAPARESGAVCVFALKWWDFMWKEGRRYEVWQWTEGVIWFWSLKCIQTVFDWVICAAARSKKKWAQKKVNTVFLSFVLRSFFVIGYFFFQYRRVHIRYRLNTQCSRLTVNLKSIALKFLPLGISLNQSQKLETPDLP